MKILQVNPETSILRIFFNNYHHPTSLIYPPDGFPPVFPPVKLSSEMITELLVTANQIAVFHNSKHNWKKSLLGNQIFRARCGGS